MLLIGRPESEYSLSSGIPQGSVLGPILWNILYNGVLDFEVSEESVVVAYADDVAVLLTASSEAQLKHRGNLALKRIGSWMESVQLQLAPHKTEAIVFRKRIALTTRLFQFQLGDLEIKLSDNVKYLGIWLDEKLNFQCHATKTGQKAITICHALSGILLKQSIRVARRRIIATAVEAKLLYGSEIWNGRMVNYAVKHLESVQRTVALKIIRGYGTVSAEAALVISGMLPLAINARHRARRFAIGVKSSESSKLNDWQDRWNRAVTGAWTRILIPDLTMWIKREFGEPDFYTTQFLTGHGGFATYLKKMDKHPDGNCENCGTAETAQHLLFECTKWTTEREACHRVTGELSHTNLIEKMIDGRQNWTAIRRLMKQMLSDTC